MEDEELLERLLQFEEVLTLGGPISWLFRQIGWAAIKGLAVLMDALQGLTESVTSLAGFFESNAIQDFLAMIQPGLYILLAISLAWLAYLFIFNKKTQREHILMNLFISVCVILGLSTAMSHMETFTTAANDVVMSDEDGTMADRVIKDNITDNALYDQFDWTVTDLEEQEVDPNNIREDRVRQISLVEEINEDTEIGEGEGLTDEGKAILRHKVVTDPSGTMYVAELKNGWLDFFPEQYYRFDFNFGTIFVTLLVTSVTLLFTAYKVARLCYEIAFNHVLAVILAYADIQHGQMLKSVLKNIINMFAIIIMIFLSMRLYTSFMAYLADAEVNAMVSLVAMIAASAAVIDGPKICERVFGIDAGLKSAWGAAAGTYAAAKGGAAAMKAGTQMATKGASGLAAGAAGAVGAAAGLKGGGQGGKGDGPSGSGSGVQKGMTDQKQDQNKDKGSGPALHEQMSEKGQGAGDRQQQGNGQGQSQGQQGNDQHAVQTPEGGAQEPIHQALSNEQDKGETSTPSSDGKDMNQPSANQQGQPIHKQMQGQAGQGEKQGGPSATPKPSIHSDMKQQGIGGIGQAAQGGSSSGGGQPSNPTMPDTPSVPVHDASQASEGPSGSSEPMYEPQGSGYVESPVSNHEGPVSGQGSSTVEQPVQDMSAPRTEDIPYQPTDQPSQATYQATNQPSQANEPVQQNGAQQGNHQPEQRTWGMFASQKSREWAQGTKTYQRSKRSYDLSKNTTSNWKETRANAKRLETERRQKQKQARQARKRA